MDSTACGRNVEYLSSYTKYSEKVYKFVMKCCLYFRILHDFLRFLCYSSDAVLGNAQMKEKRFKHLEVSRGKHTSSLFKRANIECV